MNKSRLFIILIILGSFLGACSTHYQVARKHFDKGQSYYERSRYGRSFREYSKTLDAIAQSPHNPYLRFLQAALHHQFYLIDIVSIREKIRVTKYELLPLTELIDEKPDEVDFLGQAFSRIIALEADTKQYDIERVEPWLLVEKDIIIGDVFVREASQGASQPDLSAKAQAGKTNAGSGLFRDKLFRYALYEIARNFYLNAFLTANRTSYQNSGDLIGSMGELGRRRLKDVYWSLSVVANSLAHAELDPEFAAGFKTQSRQYLEVMKKIDQYQPRHSGQSPPGENAVLNLLGTALDKNLLVLDAEFHIKEGRTRMSLAVEEMLVNKKTKAGECLLVALKHFLLARELPWAGSFDGGHFINASLDDIYLNLDRLSR